MVRLKLSSWSMGSILVRDYHLQHGPRMLKTGRVESNLESFNQPLNWIPKVCSLPVYGSLYEFHQDHSLKVLKDHCCIPALLLKVLPLR